MADIKQYWDERARQSEGSAAATTNDVYLRLLEVKTLSQELGSLKLDSGATILDVGCGDGRMVCELAEVFSNLHFHGADFSGEMIQFAQESIRQKPAMLSRIEFQIGDATELGKIFSGRMFPVITSNRCLINLGQPEKQYDALRQISEHLTPGGVYLGTENFIGGQTALNNLRKAMKLEEIPIRWHNTYFDEDEFLSTASKFFSKVELINFSSAYYYVTRVVYSSLCKLNGVAPDYLDPIHRVAMELPAFGDFSPIKLIRARR